MHIFDYKLELEKYPLVSQKIELEKRCCSDGVCCFIESDTWDPQLVNKKRTKSDIFLVVAPIISYNYLQRSHKGSRQSLYDYLSSATLEKVLLDFGFRQNQNNVGNGWKIQAGEKCEDLGLNYKISGDTLFLQFGCSKYESRPDICREYPQKPICTYARYCRPVADQMRNSASTALFMYAFNKKKYPDLAGFSVGEIKIGFIKKRKYLLVPCPHFDSLCDKLSSIIPSNYYPGPG